MKRIKVKFDDILSIDGLLKAFYDCKKGKSNRKDVMLFEMRLGNEIAKLYRELKSGEYRVGMYCVFCVYEPKERMIFQPHLRDLVVQRLIYNSIYDEVDKRMFYHTYGTRKGRGIHAASKLAQRYMSASNKNSYYIQFDIKKYFASIKETQFKTMLERNFKDKKLREMMMKFFTNGVAIGNLLSGIYGMLFLRRLDFVAKHEMKAKYIRFMDDFVFFDIEKSKIKILLQKVKNIIEKYELNFSKIKINKTSHGLNFVGFRTFRGYRLVRKRAILVIKKRIKNEKIENIKSILGHAKETASFEYCKKLFKENT